MNQAQCESSGGHWYSFAYDPNAAPGAGGCLTGGMVGMGAPTGY